MAIDASQQPSDCTVSQAAWGDFFVTVLVGRRDIRTTGTASSVSRNLRDRREQLVNASRPSAVNLCELVSKPRMTSERYTPFGMGLEISRQVLASAQTCNLYQAAERLTLRGLNEAAGAAVKGRSQ